MKFAQGLYRAAATVLCVAAMGYGQAALEEAATAGDEGTSTPQFRVDPFWPKPLPNNWLVGEIAGIAVDSEDRILVLQRPGTLGVLELGAAQSPPTSICCMPAPPILEFDAEGNLLQSWGGPASGYDWPGIEHGLSVDYQGNVWVAGEGSRDPETGLGHSLHGDAEPMCVDHQVLKFSRDGTFLLQIGQAGRTGGSNNTEFLGHPADMEVDPETNEVYVTDGYLNRRVIVFDADTGEYKRHWGAYGNKPDDTDLGPYDPSAPPSQQFHPVVHSVRISNDGLVYVADRVNDRIQVFQKDGTFVKEVIIAKDTIDRGSAWDVDFSPDEKQTFLYNADGVNQRVWILRREDLEILGSFGRRGRSAGQFHWVHKIAVDSHGNIYTGEVNTGRRLQKFVLEKKTAT